MGKSSQLIYEFGPFRLCARESVLLRAGEPVPLTPKAFDTLLLLIENRGHILEKNELMKRLWPSSFVEENNLNQNISVLRKALGEAHGQQRYIETISKRGYRFIAAVRETREANGRRGVPFPSAGSQRGMNSISVLPFRPLGSNRSDDYLGLGMADALITKLGNLSQIVVRPTSAVRKYNSVSQTPAAAGKALKVDAILEGTIQKAAGKIRVTVQFVRVEDGATLWAARFDEKFTNIFDVQDSISDKVSELLMLKLSAEDRKRLIKHGTESSEAHNAYLRGRYFWNKRTEEGLRKAIDYFQQAVEIDPGYALAHGGIADCYTLLGEYGYMAPRVALSLARSAASRALEIDEGLAEAHTSLADVKLFYDWDWKGAKCEFERALELNPNYATGYHWYSWYFLGRCEFQSATATIGRAKDLDPLSLIINTTVAMPYYYARQYDRALELLRQALEMDDNFALAHTYMGMCQLQRGQHEEALREFQRARSLEDIPRTLALLGCAEAASGDLSRAHATLQELTEVSARRYVSPYNLACIHASCGEHDQAFDDLDAACREHCGGLIWLKIDPILDPIRPDPRFQTLLRHVGLS